MSYRFNLPRYAEQFGHLVDDIGRYVRGEACEHEAEIVRLLASFADCQKLIAFCISLERVELVLSILQRFPDQIPQAILYSIGQFTQEPTILSSILRTFEDVVITFEMLKVAIRKYGVVSHDYVRNLLGHPTVNRLVPQLGSCPLNTGPFYQAVIANKLDVVNMLLEAGFKPAEENSTLVVASYYSCTDILYTLVMHGVDVNRDLDGYTYLHLATPRRDVERTRLILGCGADATLEDPYGFIPLLRWNDPTDTPLFTKPVPGAALAFSTLHRGYAPKPIPRELVEATPRELIENALAKWGDDVMFRTTVDFALTLYPIKEE